MEQAGRLKKIATISGFVILVTAFVMYRSGFFESSAIPGHLRSRISRSAAERPDSTAESLYLMPSSKSLHGSKGPLLVDEEFLKRNHLQDDERTDARKANGKPLTPLIPDSIFLTDKQIMFSSKSGVVAKEGILNYIWDHGADTTAKKQGKVKVDSFFLDESEIMGSSKSGRIFSIHPDSVKRIPLKKDSGNKAIQRKQF